MHKPMIRVLLLLAGLAGLPAAGQDLTLAVNGPTELGGTLYEWNQTVDASLAGSPTYALRFDGGANGLDAETRLDALTLLSGAQFLFSTEAPFSAAGVTYQPGDVVRFDGNGQYSIFLDAAQLGVEPDVNLDALALDAQGRLLVSFDAPVETANGTLMPNDVALVDNGQLWLVVSGSLIGLPDDVNVTGYEIGPGGDELFQFDVPVELAGVSYLPSDVVAFAGGAWSVYFSDPAFPADAAGSDFAVPCVGATYGGELRSTKVGPATELTWTAGGAALYDLVRGDLATLRATDGDFTLALDAIVPAGDVCMLDDAVALSVDDPRPDPAPGEGYFYLVRAVAGCGAGGGYDAGGAQVGSRDAEIAAAAGACP